MGGVGREMGLWQKRVKAMDRQDKEYVLVRYGKHSMEMVKGCGRFKLPVTIWNTSGHPIILEEVVVVRIGGVLWQEQEFAKQYWKHLDACSCEECVVLVNIGEEYLDRNMGRGIQGTISVHWWFDSEPCTNRPVEFGPWFVRDMLPCPAEPPIEQPPRASGGERPGVWEE